MTAANGKTFSYDSQNDLVSMNGGAVQVMYDGDGNRVAKAVTSGSVTTTTYYLVDSLNPTGLPQVMDELTNGVVTRTYTHGLQRISEDQIQNGTWTPSFYLYDGGGSVRQLTNASGAVTDAYEFDAFGNEISHTGTTPNEYLYRGEQYDSDLGLYYLRHRYYNPITGRFMSRDPMGGKLIDPTSLHKYLYADGDPINGSDPMGKEDLFEYRFSPGPTLICGGSLYCGVSFKAVVITALIFGAIAESIHYILSGEPPPPHVPGQEPGDPYPTPEPSYPASY